MPTSPLHALILSADQTRYELFTQGHLKQRFRPEDEKLWLDWLHHATSFAFQGSSGRLNVYKETRRRAGHYWYAYHTTRSHTHKRYLGQTTNVTFARLEETATVLANVPLPVPLASMLRQSEAASHGRVLNTPRSAEQRAELLATKFTSSHLPTALLERERLLNKLDAMLSNSLLLLSASAESGKTTPALCVGRTLCWHGS